MSSIILRMINYFILLFLILKNTVLKRNFKRLVLVSKQAKINQLIFFGRAIPNPTDRYPGKCFATISRVSDGYLIEGWHYHHSEFSIMYDVESKHHDALRVGDTFVCVNHQLWKAS
jgi:hypothetical protein